MSLFTNPHTLNVIHTAITDHGLPNDFVQTVERFYWPLAQQIAKAKQTQAKESETTSPSASRTFFVGIQGSQGSGKSTCADFIKILLGLEFELDVLVASIDDFYLTLSERQAIAGSIHPLFITRGVPGTHDVDLMHTVFDAATMQSEFLVPVFDKSQDDRAPQARWQRVQGPMEVVILEGWCVGLPPEEPDRLIDPINELEDQEDADGIWRKRINQALTQEYQTLFKRLDHLIALQAPSFDCVYGWRRLQEEKLTARLSEQGLDSSKTMNSAQLKRFISHYQRLTEHALRALPKMADTVLCLDENHRFVEIK